jgi:hypothetical protein
MPNIDTYQMGDVVTVRVDFVDPVLKTPRDPGTVTLTIPRPDKTVLGPITYTDAEDSPIRKVGPGSYEYDLQLTQKRQYHGRWHGTTGDREGAVVPFTLVAVREPEF